jgi:hypothetical protein
MAEAILTLSQALDRANADHTDDFAVGQRMKAHPATDTFMRGDVYVSVERISRGPKAIGAREDGSQWQAHSVCGLQSASC